MCVTTVFSHRTFDVHSSTSSLVGLFGMEPWLKISLLLCFFGLLKEFRPSEPFINKYLRNPPMNFTEQEISQEIFPISIYAFMVELIIVFLVTDYLRYKVIIVLDAISGFTVYLILIFGRSLFLMQVMEVIYGLFMACEVAYYSYIYAKVDKQHFQKVSSHTRMAYLIGRAISGIVSQVGISTKLLTYYHLQILTAGGMALAVLWALFLPPVENSIYFHRSEPVNGVPRREEESTCRVLNMILMDLKHAFSNRYVVKLLIWSIISTGGFYQVISYIQVLWDVISSEEKQTLWNGAVETSYTLLGSLAMYAVGKIQLPWYKYSEALLAINSLLMAVSLYLISQTDNLWIAYIMYIGFCVLYQTTITVVNSEIAKNLKEDSYGLIFGVAMFFSIVIQSLLTFVFVSGSGLSLPTKLQFVIYGGYYNTLGVFLIFKMLLSSIMKICNRCHNSD